MHPTGYLRRGSSSHTSSKANHTHRACFVRLCVQDFQRAEPELDLAQVLAMDPSMVFRFSFRHHPNLSSALGRRTAAGVAAPAAERA